MELDPDSQPGNASTPRAAGCGRLYSVTSVNSGEAKSPSLDNCLLIIQKVRVGVPTDAQN